MRQSVLGSKRGSSAHDQGQRVKGLLGGAENNIGGQHTIVGNQGNSARPGRVLVIVDQPPRCFSSRGGKRYGGEILGEEGDRRDFRLNVKGEEGDSPRRATGGNKRC